MFQPVECFVGLRYLRSRRQRGFASFMSSASLVGIALGVAALIVILSVMNGFERELRTRLLSMSAHATVADTGPGLAEWQALETQLASQDGVTGTAPFVSLEGMLAAGANRRPALIRGIVPGREREVSDVARIVPDEVLQSLEAGAGNVALGRVLALNLGVTVGDRISVFVPKLENGRPVTRPASFIVSGVFEAGIQEHDTSLALVDLDTASRLEGLGGHPEGVALRMDDPMRVLALAATLEPSLPNGQRYSDWTREHQAAFRAIRIEKIMMTIILFLIVAVAAFNIVASLMMVVTEKERDIAILRTCGLEPARVSRIFLVQGSLIGLGGTLVGTALGLLLATNVGTIVPWLESTFNFQIMPGDVYYVTEIPAEIHAWQVSLIPILALLIAVVATVFPSRRAAAVAPAQALRYE